MGDHLASIIVKQGRSDDAASTGAILNVDGLFHYQGIPSPRMANEAPE